MKLVQKAQVILIEKPWFTWGIFLFGIFIRIYNLDVRPLWKDEAWVAILASSDSLYSAIFTDLPIPPLFTASLYLSVHIFENNEFFLRIIPALFGIGGMFLIYYIARTWFGKVEAIGALIIFSFLPVLIAYSRELKQYSSDIFFGLLLILIAEYLIQSRYRHYLWGVLAISGAVGLWFSYPLVFILCSIGIITFWDIARHITKNNLSNRDKYIIILYWLGTFTFILISFAMLYFMVIRNQMQVWLELYFQGFFPNMKGIGLLLKWSVVSIWSFFLYFWNGYAPITLPFSLLGIWELYRSDKLRFISYWGIAFSLILIVSFFHKYPFGGSRVTLFTVPFFIILYICGLKAIWRLSKIKLFWKPIAYMGLILFAVQVADAAVYYKKNEGYFWYTQIPMTQDIKTALLLVEKARKENETLYIYYGGTEAFEYYSKYYYKKSFSPVLIGKRHWDNYPEYIKEIKPLLEEEKSFWLLATHFRPAEILYIHKVLRTNWGYQGHLYLMKNGALLIHYTSTFKKG